MTGSDAWLYYGRKALLEISPSMQRRDAAVPDFSWPEMGLNAEGSALPCQCGVC